METKLGGGAGNRERNRQIDTVRDPLENNATYQGDRTEKDRKAGQKGRKYFLFNFLSYIGV